MIITKQEFEAYERVRVSGVTNMWDTTVVEDLSGLDRATIREIMMSYTELMKQYPDVRKH